MSAVNTKGSYNTNATALRFLIHTAMLWIIHMSTLFKHIHGANGTIAIVQIFYFAVHDYKGYNNSIIIIITCTKTHIGPKRKFICKISVIYNSDTCYNTTFYYIYNLMH